MRKVCEGVKWCVCVSGCGMMFCVRVCVSRCGLMFSVLCVWHDVLCVSGMMFCVCVCPGLA